MRRLLILAVVAGVAAVGVAIAVAATGSTDTAAKKGRVTVSAKTIDGTKVLVDSKGRALYRSDQERRGMVLCTDACLSFWEPLKVTGKPTGRSLPGTLATVKRPDGGRQVTYNGRLLYTFRLDRPGKVTGDGFKDAFGGQKFTWRVAHPTGTAKSSGPASPTTTIPVY